MIEREFPVLIQGGMGVGVSNWELARAVAVAGEQLNKSVLGVVSGTGVEIIAPPPGNTALNKRYATTLVTK